MSFHPGGGARTRKKQRPYPWRRSMAYGVCISGPEAVWPSGAFRPHVSLARIVIGTDAGGAVCSATPYGRVNLLPWSRPGFCSEVSEWSLFQGTYSNVAKQEWFNPTTRWSKPIRATDVAEGLSPWLTASPTPAASTTCSPGFGTALAGRVASSRATVEWTGPSEDSIFLLRDRRGALGLWHRVADRTCRHPWS